MYELFAVEDVLLDEENPRFADHVDSQSAAIGALLFEDSSKLLNLAEDIARTGMLDPINPPIVTQIEDETIVLEGNRRFAALKLLRNHDLADDPSVRRRLAKIASTAKAEGQTGLGPTEVSCFVSADREEARRWIELRHTGEADGVGVRRWNAYQSNSFKRKVGTSTDWAWLFVQRVISDFETDEDLVADVRAVRDDKLTNLARLIGTADIQTSLRLDITSDRVLYKAGLEYMHDLFRVMFADLRSDTVEVIFTPEKRRTYVRGLLDAIGPEPEGSVPEAEENDDPDDDSEDVTDPSIPSTDAEPEPEPAAESSDSDTATGSDAGTGEGKPAHPLPAPHPPASGGATPPPAPGSGSPPARTRGTSLKGEPKVFRGMSLKHVNDRTRKLLKQAQVPKIDTAPGVAAVMVRVILELVVTEVGVNQGWTTEKTSLPKKVRACLLHLDPECENAVKRNKQLEMAWIKTQRSTGDGLGIDELNAYVHNFMADPTPESVRSLTTDLRYFIVELDKHLGANRK